MKETFLAVPGKKPKSNVPLGRRVWNFARWPLGILLALYIGLVIYRIPHAAEVDKTNKTIAFIRSHPITLSDVDGKHLPPAPDKAQADATVAGIDANANGIRDDVELAIYKLHPDSARIRAAELQYAKALQWQLTSVFNSETLVATIQEVSRGFSCIGDAIQQPPRPVTDENWRKYDDVFQFYLKEVESLVLNTDIRNKAQDDTYQYMTSHGDREGPACDIDFAKFT